MNLRHLLLIATVILCSATAYAKGGHGSGSHSSRATTHHSSTPRLNALGPGTGSKASSARVSGYTKKDGTHVDSYRKSTPDKSFKNNWSTKGNVNLATGKAGTRLAKPGKN
jgi:hypothetical protein